MCGKQQKHKNKLAIQNTKIHSTEKYQSGKNRVTAMEKRKNGSKKKQAVLLRSLDNVFLFCFVLNQKKNIKISACSEYFWVKEPAERVADCLRRALADFDQKMKMIF
ncbi:CLUMA_CG008043, isoform A [Clunio marinus]|uniref:CLUMA_CG008043, isoform A n=1 Tax=Clunio marinus TaxID=568069 RepID=A0A1J1I4M2_9DIPT|nr:CLUMA_CG008043, isoform A [Clunio marinus]